MPLILVEGDCLQCGCPFFQTLSVSYPDFTADRSKDMGVYERHYFSCRACDKEIEVDTSSEMFGITATMDGNRLSCEEIYEPDSPDEDYVPPHDVFARFEEAQSELQAVLWATTDPFDDDPKQPSPALARMVYSQNIAVLEAYLADRIHREALDNPKVKWRIIRASRIFSTFREQKVALTKMIESPDFAERQFASVIKSLIYHRFNDVDDLYRAAFRNAPVFPSDDNRKELEAAVVLRHDCVHRNGADKDGKVQPISAADVEKVAKAMRALVAHIEQVIEDCQAKDAEAEAPTTSGPSPGAAVPE